MSEERIDPDFDSIIELCKAELVIKFPNYGNTWLSQDDLYYKERLLKEAREYSESMTIDSEKRKLLNIINIAAMAHQSAAVNRGCRNHKPAWIDIINSKGLMQLSVCLICGKSLWVLDGVVTEAELK